MTDPRRPARAAEIVREYGPFAGAERVHGVTHDGRRVWAATGAKLVAFDLESGRADLFYCGGGASGKVRAVRRPKGVRS
jgi:hypothetical protein